MNLLLEASTIHPTLRIFPSDTKSIVAALPPSNPTSTQSILDPLDANPPPQASSTSQLLNAEAYAAEAIPNRPETLEMSADVSIPHEHSTNSAAVSAPDPDLEADPYDDYDTDPPAHYPKPGHGLARTMRPEAEDLQWLVDENFEVFEHIYKADDDAAEASGRDRNGQLSIAGNGDVDAFVNGSSPVAGPAKGAV